MTVSLAQASSPATQSAPALQRLAIVVRDDAFDRLLTPLTFAWEMGQRGVEVDVLFVLWAARVLTHDGVEQVRMDLRYADREGWLLGRLAKEGAPQDAHGFIRGAHATGRVRLHACALAAATFGVRPDNLLPEAAGIIDPAVFLNQIVMRADHCQYF